MEEKNYEAGKVVISSAEYRDLVAEAVEARMEVSQKRSDYLELKSEKDKLTKELELANKKIAELESVISNLQTGLPYYGSTTPCKPWWSEVTCSNTAVPLKKEEN